MGSEGYACSGEHPDASSWQLGLLKEGRPEKSKSRFRVKKMNQWAASKSVASGHNLVYTCP